MPDVPLAPDRSPADELAERRAVAERFARFARDEAPDRSDVYAGWAREIAGDPAALAVLARIPARRRQPPLVFAVARMLGADAGLDGAGLARWVIEHADRLVAEASTRLLQTNDPARCALLLPALALIEGPIALIELGASAGLCLYPDRYAYRYETPAGAATTWGSGAPLLTCDQRGKAPLPALRGPQIIWRAGLDLQPLDARDPQDRAFLRGLVWPGEAGRDDRIAVALDVVAGDPPMLRAGDIGRVDASGHGDLEALARDAPAGATLVVTAPGVTPHLPWPVRQALPGRIASLGARFLAIEPPPRPDGAPAHGPFRVELDGRVLGFCDPLGEWLEWLPGEGPVAA
ncbi:DUF2332 domain-containing protein [uncultured Microbacterium sp.]|uniref:DUF2332 domain-containing protein n=1 Tax=uncultured Microbacterium sp. TaxID=191216 RepID=UPI0025F35DB9|nr:DUF2332 domain-containing protein [uncultured Microbacterium sp.]